jgi:DNA primase
MLTTKNKTIVVNVLDGALGVGSSLKGSEQAHHCPFCHHHKKKLQVNLETQNWHCWVCDAKGRSIKSLLKKLNVESKEVNKIIAIYGDDDYTNTNEPEFVVKLQLPKEFLPLWKEPQGFEPNYKQAIHYLKERGIGKGEILKYNIGYCKDGLYGGRIIIPSYDSNGELNYFVARAFYDSIKMKYKNPPVSKNVIVFENQINWNEPITLVEGVFDSFSVKRNVIPLLGKFLPTKLKEKIFETGIKDITIILDSDAVSDSTKHTDFFLKNGIRVKNIIPSERDAGEMGFTEVNQLIKNTEETGWDDMVLSKLKAL